MAWSVQLDPRVEMVEMVGMAPTVATVVTVMMAKVGRRVSQALMV